MDNDTQDAERAVDDELLLDVELARYNLAVYKHAQENLRFIRRNGYIDAPNPFYGTQRFTPNIEHNMSEQQKQWNCKYKAISAAYWTLATLTRPHGPTEENI